MKEFAGPSATILPALVALIVTAYFALQNVRISREQIRQSRFDKRLDVYLSARAFQQQLIGWTGSEEQQKTKDRFFVALHAAYFLFDGDATITAILAELSRIGVAISGYKENSKQLSIDPTMALKMFNETSERLIKHFPDRMEALKVAMKPFMDVSILKV